MAGMSGNMSRQGCAGGCCQSGAGKAAPGKGVQLAPPTRLLRPWLSR
jgi:hypothetical protein